MDDIDDLKRRSGISDENVFSFFEAKRAKDQKADQRRKLDFLYKKTREVHEGLTELIEMSSEIDFMDVYGISEAERVLKIAEKVLRNSRKRIAKEYDRMSGDV